MEEGEFEKSVVACREPDAGGVLHRNGHRHRYGHGRFSIKDY